MDLNIVIMFSLIVISPVVFFDNGKAWPLGFLFIFIVVNVFSALFYLLLTWDGKRRG